MQIKYFHYDKCISGYSSKLKTKLNMFHGENVSFIVIALLTLKYLKSLCLFLYQIILPTFKPCPDLIKMGSWAVVTGATDGIGKAFAEELAEKGFNIVLISRTKLKLEMVAKEISEMYNVEVKIVEADFTKGDSIFPLIENELKDMDIGVLVNNVGKANTIPEYFLELKNKFVFDILKCNIFAMIGMCQIVMPGMVERKKGVVINISSVLDQVSCPLFTVYGGTKSFITKFSKDLAIEYENKGIIVSCLAPGPVATKMIYVKKTSWMIPSPKNYVKSSLSTIGTQTYSNGFPSHKLLALIFGFITSISSKLTWYMFRSFSNLVKRKVKILKERRQQNGEHPKNGTSHS